jgi:hypothetical protein
VSVSALEPHAGHPQVELFEEDRREDRLTQTLDRLRDRMGEAALVPAGSLTHRRALGHVPFGSLPGRGGEGEG